MLHYYSSQNERNRFIEKLEKLLLEGFGTGKRVIIDEWRWHEIKSFYDEIANKSTFFMSKEEKERVQKEQKEAEGIHIKALEMLKDASKLNRAILSDMEKNPEEYINLLKRRVFNPHQCNITWDTYSSEMTNKARRGHPYHEIQCGNFALLYAFLTNWIKDEDMTIMECYAIYQRFGFPCNIIKPSSEQKILVSLLHALAICHEYKPMIFDAVEHLVVRDNKLASDETPKIFVRKNSSFVKLFVEYWDYKELHPLIRTDNIWNNLSLEEMVEQGRQGIGPVTRTPIPWETRRREKYHTFMGGVYENCSEPAPEKIRYSYFRDFKEILKLNVHNGVREETKYENGREIGYTLFIDEQDIINLPFEIDWERIERWTQGEEKQFREKQERERRAEEENKKILESFLR